MHEWIYLGNNSYRCQKCGLIISRADLVAGDVSECRSDVVDRLDALEARVNVSFDAIDAQIKSITGVTG